MCAVGGGRPRRGRDTNFWLAGYALLGLASFLLLSLRALLYARFLKGAAQRLHAQALKGVLRSPVAFFDTTPAGRILNRFAQDQVGR